MTPLVSIVDYGVGNLFSLARAIEHAGGRAELVATPEAVAAAERLILPGVGACGACAKELHERNLFEPVRAYASGGRPLLGICVGMQLFAESSDEFGHHSGLALMRGSVSQIAAQDTAGRPLRIPHVGWNELKIRSAPVSRLMRGFTSGVEAYFVHSFAVNLDDGQAVAATCEYGGYELLAALERDNLYGCQFHPEKSGPDGLRMLRNFLFHA